MRGGSGYAYTQIDKSRLAVNIVQLPLILQVHESDETVSQPGFVETIEAA